MNLNKVFLIGRLTNDPQLRSTAGGQSVGTFSIATNRTWMSKAGEKQEEVQFHNVVVWGRQAEITSQFLKKGSLVMVEGRIQNRTWQDKQGQNRTTTEIICEHVQFGPRGFSDMGSRGGSPSSSPSREIQEDAKEILPEINLDEGGGEIRPEDIPF